jgi:hypothetical protein
MVLNFSTAQWCLLDLELINYAAATNVTPMLYIFCLHSEVQPDIPSSC